MSFCPVCRKERGQINKCEVCEYDFQKPRLLKMKPLTEIKKGCGGNYKHEQGMLWFCGMSGLCPTCQALLEQSQEFEKMIENKIKYYGGLLDKSIERVEELNQDGFTLAKCYKVIDEKMVFNLKELLKEVQGDKNEN